MHIKYQVLVEHKAQKMVWVSIGVLVDGGDYCARNELYIYQVKQFVFGKSIAQGFVALIR